MKGEPQQPSGWRRPGRGRRDGGRRDGGRRDGGRRDGDRPDDGKQQAEVAPGGEGMAVAVVVVAAGVAAVAVKARELIGAGILEENLPGCT